MAPKSLQELPKTANKAPWSFPRLDFWISQLDSGVLGIQNQSLEFQDWTLNFKTELDLTSRLDFQTGLPDWTFGAGLCTSRLIWTRLQHFKRFWGEIPSVDFPLLAGPTPPGGRIDGTRDPELPKPLFSI